MKRIFCRKYAAIFLMVLMIISVTACGGSGKSDNTEGTTESAALQGQEKEEKITDAAENPLENYKIFSSEKMGFSFLYEPEHTAYLTDAGAAEIAINGDDSLVGLFVSVGDAESMPTPEDILEEEMFNLSQEYQNAMVEQPQMGTDTIEGHEVTAIFYSYSNAEGKTVDCSEFIEVRDGKYIFYRTAAYHESSDPELEALGTAIVSLVFSADAYGASDAENGSISKDTTPDTNEDAGWGDSAPADSGSPDMQSGFHFDVEDTWLIISDETTTMVYLNGVMEGDYFAAERVTLDDSIGNTLVKRKNEVQEFLAERTVTAPQVYTMEIGDRKLAGIEYAYSSVDGTKTICGAEYYEQIGNEVYNWYATYDQVNTTAPDAMRKAMETFVVE